MNQFVQQQIDSGTKLKSAKRFHFGTVFIRGAKTQLTENILSKL